MTHEFAGQIECDGFAILTGVFASGRVGEICRGVERLFESMAGGDAPIRSSRGGVYAARNLLELWPGTLELATEPKLARAVREVLGNGCGLVRALYFDKPPGRSWSLPWHKDMTIAVRDNRRPSEHFKKPTTKAGVPHVEAPLGVLERMLTARVHLDDVTDENGPLLLVPGSHRTGKQWGPIESGTSMRSIQVAAGDVLLMRPLVAHASGNSREGTRRHRRIVHLEFAAAMTLPDGFDWHDFIRLS